MDNEAIDVKWEVVIEDDPKQLEEGSTATSQVLAHGERHSKGHLSAPTDDINTLALGM